MMFLIIAIIISLLMFWVVSACVYFTDFRAWKTVAKNLDKIDFIKNTYDKFHFILYSKDRNIAIAEIELYGDKEIYIQDKINGEMYIKPTPYFFFCHRLVNRLISLIPSEEQINFTKESQNKSFKDYL